MMVKGDGQIVLQADVPLLIPKHDGKEEQLHIFPYDCST